MSVFFGRRNAPALLFSSVLTGMVLAGTLPSAVSAHEPHEKLVPYQYATPTPAPGLPVCADRDWSSPIVKIHTTEFANAVAGTGTKDDMVQAITDVNAQIARVGGSTVEIEKTEQTTAAFHRDYAYADTTPTIHVGYQALDDPAIMGTTTPYSCERFIAIDTATRWNYFTPEDAISNDHYYLAGKHDPAGYVYARLSYQHELMHAFKIYTTPNDDIKDNHPDNVYSFLNYQERPWAHTSKDSMIRPLPYDVRKLRNMYPASNARTEVSVLNTWIDKSQTPADGSGTTPQEFLCAPSVGASSGDAAMFGDYCGNPGATAFCPGDTLQVRYTLANYSTELVNVTANLWLSKDDVWDTGDTISPTSASFSVDAAHSEEHGQAFELPALSGSKLYPIIRVTATTPSGVTVKDSIPLRGTLSEKLCAIPQKAPSL